MGIQSISCGLPFCGKAEGEQSTCSLISRVSLVVLGSILLLVGILALLDIPGLHALGTIGGSASIAAGGLILLAGFCLRCVQATDEENSSSQSNKKIPFIVTDPRARGTWSVSGSSTSSSGTTTDHKTYCSLNKFLESTQPQDVAIRDRLTRELGIADLTSRIEENFPKTTVVLALPLQYENNIRNDELLFQIVKLISLSTNEILNLPVCMITLYGDDARNMLRLRLNYVEATLTTPCAVGTLGAFLAFRNQIFADVPPHLYPFLTNEQVIYFLQNLAVIDKKIVKALLPSSKDQPFIAIHSKHLLSKLPIASINTILPHLHGELLLFLIQTRGSEPNYTLLTNHQVGEIFPSGLMEKNETQKRMGLLPIEVLNQILPKMSGEQLQLIPNPHLKDRQLNLKALPDAKIKSMFPTDLMNKHESQKRIRALHADNRKHVESIVKFT